jgi:hypothetical protein
MIGKLLRREETSVGLVLILSVTILVLVANGGGPLSLKRVVSGALSNPVPWPESAGAHDSGVSFRATHSRTAA